MECSGFQKYHKGGSALHFIKGKMKQLKIK